MSIPYILQHEIRAQVEILESFAKAVFKSPATGITKQVFALFDVLGTVARKQEIRKGAKREPIQAAPIEAVKGIGKKLGAKLRVFGIKNIRDLERFNPKSVRIPGISQRRIIAWQNSLR
ncbi:MAG: hypothetical protein ACTSRS_09630 [Candidatus Helarchaeota archaeon]